MVTISLKERYEGVITDILISSEIASYRVLETEDDPAGDDELVVSFEFKAKPLHIAFKMQVTVQELKE